MLCEEWQSFLQSPLSNMGQAIASYKEIAAPIVQMGNATVMQLHNSSRKCDIKLGIHVFFQEACTCDLPQDIFH